MPSPARRPLRPFPSAAALGWCAVGTGLAAALACTPVQAAQPEPAHPAPAAQASHPAAAVVQVASSVLTSTEWSSLGRTQQAALAPLARHWPTLTEVQRRKWIEISHNFNALGPTDQQRLHARMSEWAQLSTRERTQARLNYAGVKGLTSAERQEKWRAYQALSPEQKKQLATQASANTLHGASVPLKPIASSKLAATAATPAIRSGRATAHQPLPKIVTAPQQVTRSTLLPVVNPVASAAPGAALPPSAAPSTPAATRKPAAASYQVTNGEAATITTTQTPP